MKVSGNYENLGGGPKVSGIYDSGKNVNKAEKTDGVTGKKDVVSISNQAKDFQTAMKALKEIPDIRKDKVENWHEKLSPALTKSVKKTSQTRF